MILGLKKVLQASITAYRGAKDKWIRDFPGQLLITTGMIAFSVACTKVWNVVRTWTVCVRRVVTATGLAVRFREAFSLYVSFGRCPHALIG